MPKIEDLDPNFKLESNIEREGMTFYDVKKPPFRLYGVFYEDSEKKYTRMAHDDGFSVSEGVGIEAYETAGGRVRFITNSPYVILKTRGAPGNLPHMPRTGSGGFDLYVRLGNEERYTKTFVPNFSDTYDGVVDFNSETERLMTINFPLYGDVHELYIGVKEGCVLKAPTDYTVDKPIVFYGSSITQGGCASRPGTSYEAILSRRYDADYINLGFSGCAKGETYMAEYIAAHEMSAFVYDYDFNTPSVDHFWKTHEPFFKIIREKHPDLPIIMMSRPNPFLDPARDKRHEVIRATYDNAVARGDKNVYIIPGNELMAIAGNDGTVDGTHPTDLGFFSMAQRVAVVLDTIFERKQ